MNVVQLKQELFMMRIKYGYVMDICLVIGLFIYEFLSIHPFQDGNGQQVKDLGKAG